jgi:hypothetical protein
MRTCKALILNDYEGAHYASLVQSGKKPIETRMNRLFSYRGDIIICCGMTNSVTDKAGKALCMVEIYDGGPMQPEHADASCIEWHKDRKVLFLRNWRYFSREFRFNRLKVSGTWQGIFEITIPEDVQLIPKPEIKSYHER